jgi:gliding-associated putative ABC transporter substrate-binding component GldG
MKNTISILLIAGIVVFLNLLADHYFFRWDLTKEKQYTMSKATSDILKDLEDPITIKAYFTENLPQNIVKTREDFKNILIEYANISKGMVEYEFVDPTADETIEQEAMQNGIAPIMINVREKDEVTQQKAYLGAILKMGDRQEVLPFIQPGSAMEYSLTKGIKKIAIVDKPSLAFVEGHGEAPLQDLSQAYEGLSVLYNIESIDLSGDEGISDRFRAIIMLGPKDSIPASHLSKLDDYLKNGGNVLLAFDRVQGDLQAASGTELDVGLHQWLANKNIIVDNSFITDASCGTVNVQQRRSFFNFSSQVQFPYFPMIQKFNDHPITRGLERIMLPFASPIRYQGDTSLTFTPFLSTSDKAGSMKAPLRFDINKKWTQADFPQSGLTMGAIFEGKFSSDKKAKLIVITDSEFAVSGQRGQSPDNVNLLVNSIDWLSDDTGLIELRTKGVYSRPIEEIEEAKRSMYKYLNFLLPILLVILYGFFRVHRSRSKRNRRMQENWS